jgi:septal ring factor EnvC (AmiA/AmiB activator)
MKTTILKMTFLGAITAAAMTSCNNSPDQKVVEAKQELNQARLDSSADYIKFKEEADMKLKENDRKIADLKEKLKKERKETREKYDKQIEELDQKNTTLKTRVKEYKKEEDKTRWESFKDSFNKDMDDLGKSISRTAEKNRDNK